MSLFRMLKGVAKKLENYKTLLMGRGALINKTNLVKWAHALKTIGLGGKSH